jgi:nucleoside-diphosphate-sugar epimerase
MSRRVLVTGGSGFIGTNLVESLVQDRMTVVNLDHSPPLRRDHGPYWKRTDLLDPEAVGRLIRRFRPEQVVHLAARTDLARNTVLADYAVNTTGTSNLLDAMEGVGTVTRAVVASSMLVCRLGYLPRSDTDYAPDTVYGESKVETERIIRVRDPRFQWALIRPTTIWGPYQLRLRDEFFRLLRTGHYVHPSGRPCRRSYGYVGNTVHQIRRLLEAPAEQIHGGTFYIGDPAIDLRDYVNGFSRRLTGRDVRVAPYFLMKAAAVCGDLLSALGWRSVPLTSFRLGNLTRDNVLDMSPTLNVTGPNPYTLEQGIEATAAWLDVDEASS